MELPGTEWTVEKPESDVWFAQAPLKRNWQCINQEVKHVFTHFTLYLTVFTCRIPAHIEHNSVEIIANLMALDNFALPSLMQKAIKLVMKQSHDL